jgi:hypothetical protein
VTFPEALRILWQIVEVVVPLSATSAHTLMAVRCRGVVTSRGDRFMVRLTERVTGGSPFRCASRVRVRAPLQRLDRRPNLGGLGAWSPGAKWNRAQYRELMTLAQFGSSSPCALQLGRTR